MCESDRSKLKAYSRRSEPSSRPCRQHGCLPQKPQAGGLRNLDGAPGSRSEN